MASRNTTKVHPAVNYFSSFYDRHLVTGGKRIILIGELFHHFDILFRAIFIFPYFPDFVLRIGEI